MFALPDEERVESGIALARDLVALISEGVPARAVLASFGQRVIW